VNSSNGYTLLIGLHFWMAKKLAKFGICGKILDVILTFFANEK